MLLFELAHDECALRGIQQRLAGFLGTGFAVEVELFEFLAGVARQARVERDAVFGVLSIDRPVFASYETFDLLFALDDHPQGGALHAACRQPTADLAPEQRREVETDQVVERTPGLLGVDQVGG